MNLRRTEYDYFPLCHELFIVIIYVNIRRIIISHSTSIFMKKIIISVFHALIFNWFRFWWCHRQSWRAEMMTDIAMKYFFRTSYRADDMIFEQWKVYDYVDTKMSMIYFPFVIVSTRDHIKDRSRQIRQDNVSWQCSQLNSRIDYTSVFFSKLYSSECLRFPLKKDRERQIISGCNTEKRHQSRDRAN